MSSVQRSGNSLEQWGKDLHTIGNFAIASVAISAVLIGIGGGFFRFGPAAAATGAGSVLFKVVQVASFALAAFSLFDLIRAMRGFRQFTLRGRARAARDTARKSSMQQLAKGPALKVLGLDNFSVRSDSNRESVLIDEHPASRPSSTSSNSTGATTPTIHSLRSTPSPHDMPIFGDIAHFVTNPLYTHEELVEPTAERRTSGEASANDHL